MTGVVIPDNVLDENVVFNSGLGTLQPAEEQDWVLGISPLGGPGTKLRDPRPPMPAEEIVNPSGYAEGVYRRKVYSVDSTLVTTVDYGTGLGRSLLRLLGNPVPDLEVTLMPLTNSDILRVLRLEVADKVHVTIDELGIDAEYMVESVSRSAGNGDPTLLTANVYLSPFVAGTPRLDFSPLAPFPQLTFIDFDGSDDHVNVPHNDAFNVTTGLTVEAWVRPDAPDNDGIFQKTIGDVTNTQYLLFLEAGLPKFRIKPSGAAVTLSGPTALTAGEWRHLAGVWDGTTMRVYVDGSEVASTPFAGPPSTGVGKSEIGRLTGFAYWFDGIIADVRLWNVARPAEEIARDHDRLVVGDEDGLVGWWPLNEAEGVDAFGWVPPFVDGTYAGDPAREEIEWLQLTD